MLGTVVAVGLEVGVSLAAGVDDGVTLLVAIGVDVAVNAGDNSSSGSSVTVAIGVVVSLGVKVAGSVARVVADIAITVEGASVNLAA